MIYKKVVRNSFSFFFAVLLNNGCLFAANILMARLLPQTEYSTIVFVLSIAGLCILFADFGIYNAAMFFIPRQMEDKQKLERTIASIFQLSLGFGVIASLVLFILSFVIPGDQFKGGENEQHHF
jgi:O-antigen/teichoic acid export membrane protein|tara:strand:- start:7987 stop:8358 length:372 start_codon:yes stop_codon:yes gene_type:complete